MNKKQIKKIKKIVDLSLQIGDVGDDIKIYAGFKYCEEGGEFRVVLDIENPQETRIYRFGLAEQSVYDFDKVIQTLKVVLRYVTKISNQYEKNSNWVQVRNTKALRLYEAKKKLTEIW